MSHSDYTQLIKQFPGYIPLPRIDRPHRSLNGTLAEVTEKSDLPSRLLFGDLVGDSFRKDENGWSVEYRDGSGNGVDLNVSAGRFEAKSFFLGSESFSVGPAGHKEAFLQLISLAGEQWVRVLKKYLDARYSISVTEPNEGSSNVCCFPDGWLQTLLIPLPLDRLEDVLNFHLDLAGDPLLGASQLASIALQSQVVNYVEGRAPEGCDDPMALVVRHLLSCTRRSFANPCEKWRATGRQPGHCGEWFICTVAPASSVMCRGLWKNYVLPGFCQQSQR
jgi:hypothetical protein